MVKYKVQILCPICGHDSQVFFKSKNPFKRCPECKVELFVNYPQTDGKLDGKQVITGIANDLSFREGRRYEL
ncbi:TPA: hypothetical protein ACHWJ6_000975 [Streptococcus suis]